MRKMGTVQDSRNDSFSVIRVEKVDKNQLLMIKGHSCDASAMRRYIGDWTVE